MPPAGSVESLTLTDILVDAPSALLLASLTIDSISTASDDPVPTFPDPVRAPLYTVVELRSCLSLSPAFSCGMRTGHEPDEGSPVTVTVPTRRRLKYFLGEGLHTGLWAVRHSAENQIKIRKLTLRPLGDCISDF